MSSWLTISLFMLLGIPTLMISLANVSGLTPVISVLIFGIGIVGAAFLITWAAEAAQVDVSASFAIAILALIAILPEYAVEAVLSWEAGQAYIQAINSGWVFEAGSKVPPEMERVAANVTGANRLLIGLGWAAVILIYWIKRRKPLDLNGSMGLEITMLIIATAVTFIIFYMQQVHIVIGFALIALYLIYLYISSTREPEEPELMGPSLTIGTQSKWVRRSIVLSLFVYSAIVIVVAAEPFVHSLVESGTALGIDEFVLIQWIAPLASESPEIIIAILFSLRSNPIAGLTALVSSEVNQLTLLVGSMMGIFSLSAGTLVSFTLNEMQSVEFLLTAAVSVLAIVLLLSKKIDWKAGVILLVLFIVHLPFTDIESRRYFVYIYLTFAVVIGIFQLYKWKIDSSVD